MPISVPDSALSSSTTTGTSSTVIRPICSRSICASAALVDAVGGVDFWREVAGRHLHADAARRRKIDRHQRRAGVDHGVDLRGR